MIVSRDKVPLFKGFQSCLYRSESLFWFAKGRGFDDDPLR